MYIRALEGCEKALGPDHTSTLGTVHNLGSLYSDQGKLAKAETMYIRALQGCEKALGSDHTSTLGTVHSLGILYSNQGKLAEAEAMYNRALSGYTAVQGPSSHWCKQLEHRLQALQVASAESREGQNEFTESGVAKSKSLKQRLRKLGMRLNTR
jgi:tetratricopeptide (TPR) repeat protein